ncbi:MAG: phage terminase large subunit family protein [Candidatus Omnitrophota bacterium]|nr:phage terminase large subunit family protein [Candidatus Omnitrophota bacterium]
MPIKLEKEILKTVVPYAAEEWVLPEKITVSVWADRYRRLDVKTSAEPGQWSTSRTPYLKGIMDAFTDPYVDEITVMAASQVGKTEAMYNMLGFVLDQDPGPTLMVMPRADDAKSVSYNRIKPMIETSPALSRYLPKNTDDITKLEYHFDRMILYFAGSNSPADLASRPIRYLFLDEVDKYPKFSGREADPIKLASERQKTFWNKKTVKVSTPTTRDGYIFREYEKSDQRRFYVPCPHCAKKQALVFGQIKWPKEEASAERIKNDRLAWYECVHCHGRIEDIHKQRMMLNGEWIAESDQKSRNRGFWISSLYSPWLTWSDIAGEFLKSKDYIELLMNFVNSWLAEVWEEKASKTKPDELSELVLSYPKEVLPEGVIVLTGGVDVQKDHFYLSIRGWGYGQESWLILATRVEDWGDVEQIMFKSEYPFQLNPEDSLPVRLTCIDSGHRTSEVYEICRQWRDKARPIKGQQHLSGVPFRPSNIDKFPATGHMIPGGLALWHIDTSYFKDKVTRFVQNTKMDGLGGWHLYQNIHQEYLKQFCAEHKIIIRDRKHGKTIEEWRPVTAHAATHFLDTEVYSTAAAEMLRVFSMQAEDNKNTRNQNEVKQGSWLLKQNNWVRRNG